MKNKREVRNMIIAICLIIVVCVIMLIITKVEREYSMDGFIVEKHGNVFTVEDTTGNLWDFESEEEYYINDNVKVRFNDNCTTNNRIDDIIIEVNKYWQKREKSL